MTPGLLKDLAPGVLSVAEDPRHELCLFVIGRRRLAGLRGGRGRLLIHLSGQLTKNLQRILPGDPADTHDQQDGRQAQPLAAAKTHPTAATASILCA
ncbi:hypothetical protein D3C80_1672770 [compost metagenome]